METDEQDQPSPSWSRWQYRLLVFVLVVLNLQIAYLIWPRHPVFAVLNLTMAVILLAALAVSALKL